MHLNKYKVTSAIKIQEIPTKETNESAKKELKEVRKQLSKIQYKMFAEGKYSVLVCLQGMDTSGKDSLIREVFKEFNTAGINVHSFKVPTEVELKHDFLWRHYIVLPEKGKFGIFNRTHYENVLVTRVHPGYIFAENIPEVKNLDDLNDEFYHNRMNRINDFENHLTKTGTIVLKFFLHLSKEEQKKRLLRRLNLKEKNYKFSSGDLKERKLWSNYQACYEDMINKTSTDKAPWYVVPADDKPTARLIVATTILEVLEKYNFKEPELAAKYQAEIENYKAELNNE